MKPVPLFNDKSHYVYSYIATGRPKGIAAESYFMVNEQLVRDFKYFAIKEFNEISQQELLFGGQVLDRMFGVEAPLYSNNTFIGARAGNVITTGNDNVVIGHNAGKHLGNAVDNTIFGSLSNGKVRLGGSGEIVDSAKLKVDGA